MSWATVTKKVVKKKEVKNITIKVDKEEPIIEIKKYNKNHLLKDDLLKDIELIKQDIDQFTPWLLSDVNCYDILDFFDNFIDLELIDYSDDDQLIDDLTELE